MSAVAQPSQYLPLANAAQRGSDLDTQRKLAMKLIQTAVLRCSPPVSIVYLKLELDKLLRDGYECAAYDTPHRQHAIGVLYGAEIVLNGTALRTDSDLRRLLGQAIGHAHSILTCESKQEMSLLIEHALRTADFMAVTHDSG